MRRARSNWRTVPVHDEKLLTLAEVAEYLQLSPKLSMRRRHRGDGIGALALKVGRHLRWRPSDLESWLDRQAKHRQTPDHREARPP